MSDPKGITGGNPADAFLDAIHASLPKIACKKLCHGSCGPIIVPAREAERVEQKSRRRLLLVDNPFAGPDTGAGENLGFTKFSGRCSLLNQDKTCAGYDARPTICRLFGVTEDMPCPYGCTPERVLSREETNAILNAITKTLGPELYASDHAIAAHAPATAKITTRPPVVPENKTIRLF